MQEEREVPETHSEETNKTTDVEEDIRNLMNKKQNKTSKQEEIPAESVESAISLLKQLSIQYDEIEAHLKQMKTERTEDFPIELVGEIVKSTKISPALCKMIERISEQNKTLQSQIDLNKAAGTTIKNQLEDKSTAYRTVKLETKYLSQALTEATKEIKKQKEEGAAQRKRILELEAALDTQKKISKEFLREKKVRNKEEDIHEEEKQILQGIIEEKDKEIERSKIKEEEAIYEQKKTKREYEILAIQHARLKKRAEIKEKALNSTTAEMERLIVQLDKLSKSDMIKKERLEYLEINNKKKEYDRQREDRRRIGQLPRTDRTDRKNKIDKKEEKINEKDKRSEKIAQIPQIDRVDRTNEPVQDNSDGSNDLDDSDQLAGPGRGRKRRQRGTELNQAPLNQLDKSGSDSSFSDVPISFSEAVNDASVSIDDSASSNKTTTSFKEMQKRTEEMAKKFKELENLLQEIKKSNDSELDRVEERITKKK